MVRRTPLHYGIFLVAGVLITLIALLTLRTTENPEAMQLFAGIGGLFILIGIVKLLIKKLSDVEKGEKQLENKMAGGMLEPTPAPQPQRPGKEILTCARCQAKNYSSSNFCHMCGLRLR